jgi:hypothetical protein
MKAWVHPQPSPVSLSAGCLPMQQGFKAVITFRPNPARASRWWSIRWTAQSSGKKLALFAKEHHPRRIPRYHTWCRLNHYLVPCPADRLLRPEPLDFLMSIRKVYRTDNVRIRILVNKIENVKAHLWQAERGEQRIGVSRKPRNGISKSFESSKENGHGWQ